MSVPFMPFRFDDGGNLDLEKVNGNLKKLSRDIKKNQDARYTYSRHFFLLDGITNASAAALRTYAIRRPTANAGVEIVGVEIFVAAADVAVWTLACSDTTWPSITVTDLNDATIFASNSSGIGVSVPSSAADVTFTLSASGASTITRGLLVVHLRCDRGNQGDAFTGYTPTLLNSVSSDAGATLDTELAAAEVAVVCDTNADKDVRVECYAVRALGSGSSRVWRIPATARRKLALVAYTVQAAGGGRTVTFNIDGAITTVNAATTLAVGQGALAGTQADDPTNSASDTVVTITANGVVADLAYLLLFWS